MKANSKDLRYKLSWIDRFINWVEKLPVSAWIFHVGLGIFLILIQMLFLWMDGGLYAEELLPVIIFNGLAVPYLIAFIHLLDNQAITALNVMKTVLDLTESEFANYEYRLSHMPFLAPLIAGLAITVGTILTSLVTLPPARYAALGELPIFAVVFHIIDKSSAFLFGVVLYHSLRQLRIVNAINSNHIRINLFHIRPLQAFSRLTASTALGLLIFVYGWMLINPELLSDAVIFGYAIILTILAVSVFVWPLWGVHRLIEIEKQKVLHEIDLRFETVFTKFNRGFNDGDHATIERLNSTINSLEIQQKKISAFPTWPWSSETARLVLTAIALPVLLMILQYIVLQALNR